jgi:hypothetical protein
MDNDTETTVTHSISGRLTCSCPRVTGRSVSTQKSKVATGSSREATLLIGFGINSTPIGELMGGWNHARKWGYPRMKARRYVFGCAIVFAAAAFSKTSPPVVDESIGESEASWRAESKPAEELTMGKLHIQFEQTTLSKVLNAVKSGAIQHQGDAAESVLWLCYTVLTEGHNARVWIESSGEMGGSEHRVTEIAVRRIPHNDSPSDCPTLPKRFEPLTFSNGIWIGASEATVRRTFPLGVMHGGEHVFIGYQGKVSGDCDSGFDLLNSLNLTFRAGLLEAIDAGQVTSC